MFSWLHTTVRAFVWNGRVVLGRVDAKRLELGRVSLRGSQWVNYNGHKWVSVWIFRSLPLELRLKEKYTRMSE